MKKIKKQKKNLSNSGMLFVAILFGLGIFAVSAAVQMENRALIPVVSANDGEDGDSQDNEDSNDNEDENKSESESQKKESEAKKKQLEQEKKTRERAMEFEKKRQEESRKSQEMQVRGKNSIEDENEGESENDDEDVNEVEKKAQDLQKEKSDRLRDAQEKIAEAERKILEQQSRGIDVSAALATLQAAKDRLAAIGNGTTQTGATEDEGKDELEASFRSVKWLADKAKEDDLKTEKEAQKSLGDVVKRIAQVEQKISILKGLGGDTAAYESALASLQDQLTQARQLIAQTDTKAQGIAMAETLERQVKRLKSALESALLARGVGDDDLFEDHGEEVSDAAHRLQELGDIQGGKLGRSIRLIAQKHAESSDDVDNLVEDIHSRGDFAEFFLGPKYDSIDALNEKIAENERNIALLSQQSEQITDSELKTSIDEQLETLTQENSRLQSLVGGEEQKNGVFAWVFRLFR